MSPGTQKNPHLAKLLTSATGKAFCLTLQEKPGKDKFTVIDWWCHSASQVSLGLHASSDGTLTISYGNPFTNANPSMKP